MDAETTKVTLKWQDALSVFGVIFAFAAMTDTSVYFRLACFAACAICLSVYFFGYTNWLPRWRWFASFSVILLMGFLAFNAWQTSHPKIAKDVLLEWKQPPPMDLRVALSSQQLDAVAKYNGTEVPGKYLYTPTFGATLPVGMDTLSVEFTPDDSSNFKPAKGAVVALVKDDEVQNQNAQPAQRATTAKPPLVKPQVLITPALPTPITVNNAPGGFATSGGLLVNPIVNNYRRTETTYPYDGSYRKELSGGAASIFVLAAPNTPNPTYTKMQTELRSRDNAAVIADAKELQKTEQMWATPHILAALAYLNLGKLAEAK